MLCDRCDQRLNEGDKVEITIRGEVVRTVIQQTEEPRYTHAEECPEPTDVQQGH